MTRRVCLDCMATIPAGKSRCAGCERTRDRARGSRQQRGYGAEHQAERERWVPIVATGHVKCARCRGLINPATAWDLDHTPDRAGYLGPSHARCNRATASH